MSDVEQRLKLEERYERIADFMSQLATKSIESSNRESFRRRVSLDLDNDRSK